MNHREATSALKPALPIVATALLLSGLTARPGSSQGITETEPEPQEYVETEGPGHFRLGRIYLTPTFRIGSLGVDTNVFYTPIDRQVDFTTTGGPGLRIVLPSGTTFRAFAGGELQYVYFLRTKSQRRMGGNARGGLVLNGNHAQIWAEEAFQRTFSRPSYEVDERVLQDQRSTTVGAQVSGQRLRVRGEVWLERFEVDEQEYRGTDLRDTLSRDADRILLGSELRLTPKTFLLMEGDDENTRFPHDLTREADSNRLSVGARIDSERHLMGRAMVGIHWLRPRFASRGADRSIFRADADLAYRLGRKTLVGVRYDRDLQFSAWVGEGGIGTNLQQVAELRLERLLADRIDCRLFLRLVDLEGDAPVTVVPLEGEATTLTRDDTFREAHGELRYRFRHNLRIGLTAAYCKRRSNFSDFGIQGLLVGGTVTFEPPRR